MRWSLLFLIFVIIIICGKYLGPRFRLRRWRKALALDKHATIFKQLYAEIDGFGLSRQARLAQDAVEYIYGEIIFEPFIALLGLCKPNSSTVFYDLGSGTGKAVLACAMVFDVKKSCGIELFPTLHLTAKLQEQQLKKLTEYQAKRSIQFKNEDFLKTELSDATLVFINATAFIGTIWNDLSQYLEQQLASDTLVITTSKPLASEKFITIRRTEVAMSWGIVTVFIQQLQRNTGKIR